MGAEELMVSLLKNSKNTQISESLSLQEEDRSYPHIIQQPYQCIIHRTQVIVTDLVNH